MMTLQNPNETAAVPLGGMLSNLIYPYGLWALFALPAAAMTAAITTSSDPTMLRQMIHPSGEFAARFLIATMLASPLALVLRGWRGPQWMRRNRRYLGLAAFGYALLHTILYLIDRAALDPVLSDLPKFYIWTGWLAFAIFVPLAVTSNDWFVRRMGQWWKWLQRWTYAAAVLTLAHWAALNDWGGLAPALVHFGPLIGLEAYRLWYWYLRPRSQGVAQS
jgi:methionine sulfoxide reductase heme-binding subunit